ncbi:Cif family virulence factor [Hirschia baltica]|uniref:DUF4440 domain-containing protein n=1 Tax=Hirschia baltica (strain ATCC 49814 / DSM 5838 / IFAM 1418) TaxID=582402 RepID=C6XQQ0_HIRBI|nr:hypothetical protein [Hirschia baltica]ACT58656.1 hypothetical protein Hbal_0962 [Hirschia baltica ATCC 49814]
MTNYHIEYYLTYLPRRLSGLLSCLLLISIVQLPANAQSAENIYDDLPSEIAQQLQTHNKTFIQSAFQGKLTSKDAYFSEDVKILPEFQKSALGQDNAIAYFKAFSDTFAVSNHTRTRDEILTIGPKLFVRGSFTFDLSPHETDISNTVSGDYFEIWNVAAPDQITLEIISWNFQDHYPELNPYMGFKDYPSAIMAHTPRVNFSHPQAFELAGLNLLQSNVILRGDGETWKLFSEDEAILVPHFKTPRIGRDAIDEFLGDHIKELPIFDALTNQTHYIQAHDDYVITIMSHVATWRTGDASGISTGKGILLWKRQDSGELRIYRQLAAYD